MINIFEKINRIKPNFNSRHFQQIPLIHQIFAKFQTSATYFLRMKRIPELSPTPLLHTNYSYV